MLGVVNVVTPVPLVNTVPSVAAAYQSIFSPAFTEAEILTVPVPHLDPLTGDEGATGLAETTTVYVAIAAVHGLFVTVMVNVTVVPASPAAGVYTGVSVAPPEVIDPAPLSVQAMVPLDELAPLIVAVDVTHIVCVPPADAVGCKLIVAVTAVLVADKQPEVEFLASA